MSRVRMEIAELIVLVGTSIADGESYVVPETEFLKILFDPAPESSRILNPSRCNIDGYPTFTDAVVNDHLSVRLEELQKIINDRWACWDPDNQRFNTEGVHGVIDTYAFVNANCLTREAFGSEPFLNDLPTDWLAWLALLEKEKAPVTSPQSSTERKPWLL